MINNRQNGRRRGRGGTRPPNGPNNAPERGNRLDNRARGNASQLHEKYKTLARDAQMQGDRVMTEYYLQFADHYFRILGESRARFEEQRRYRDEGSDFDDDDGDEMNAGFDGDDGGQDYRQPPRQNEARRNDGRQDGRQQDGRQNDGRQNDGRQQDGRQQDGRQNDGRQNDGRQNEARQNQGRNNDAGQNNGRPHDGRQDGRGRDRDQEQSGAEPGRRDEPPRDERPRNERPNEPRDRAAPRQADARTNGNVGHERQVDVRPADMPASEPLAGEQEPAEAHAPIERVRRPRVRRDRTEPPAEVAVDALPERIEIDRLPPSFAPSATAVAAAPAEEVADEEAPRRRRTRRPRTDGAPVEA